MTGWSRTWRPGDTCGLYVDLPLGDAVAVGDWVATDAGARYLVTAARVVKARKHRQVSRNMLQCVRLERDLEPPDDVHVIWLRWYSRDRVTRG